MRDRRSGVDAATLHPKYVTASVVRRVVCDLEFVIEQQLHLGERTWRGRSFRPTCCTFLLHENTTPHRSVRTTEAVANFGCTGLPHPPYSPDIALSVYHLFGPLQTKQNKTRQRKGEKKKALQEHQHANDGEMHNAVGQWLRRRSKF